MSDARPPFPRTVCACPEDKACCTRPAHLIPSDIKRLEKQVVGPIDRYLRASPGAVVLKNGNIERVPTIVPARTADGRCVFLSLEDRCRVHENAPFGCAYFDMHMDAGEGHARSVWGLMKIMESPTYTEFRETLKPKDEPFVEKP